MFSFVARVTYRCKSPIYPFLILVPRHALFVFKCDSAFKVEQEIKSVEKLEAVLQDRLSTTEPLVRKRCRDFSHIERLSQSIN